MKIDEFVTRLRNDHNIIVISEQDDLKIRANKEDLKPEIIEEIRSRKTELLNFFADNKSDRKNIIPKAAHNSSFKLSSAQQRLYFINELESSTVYNLPQIIKLRGNIEREKIKQAFDKLIQRHEILRTCFVIEDNEPRQKIIDLIQCDIEYIVSRPAEILKSIQKFIRPFDLKNAPLLRVGIIEISDSEAIMIVDMHHIITDGASQAVMIKDFMALYNANDLTYPELQYKDYAEWQKSEFQQELLNRQKKFWLNRFEGELPKLDLPIDYARPLTKNHHGDTLDFCLTPLETSCIKSIAQNCGCTVFTVLFSVYNILVSKLCNQEDIIIGTPSAGRQHPDLENMIGMFVNILPLRNYPKGSLTFKTFLKEVHSDTLESFDNQSFQHEQLVDELKIERNLNRNPLFDTVFAYQNFEQINLQIPGLSLEPFNVSHHTSKFDITLYATQFEDKINLTFEYATSLFSHNTLSRFSNYFINIVKAISINIDIKLSDIELMTEEEKLNLLVDFNNTSKPYLEDATLVSLFEEKVIAVPNNIAVIIDNKKVSYKQLNYLANKIADKIHKRLKSKTPGIIGIYYNPSVEMIASILGVLKTGHAYLPLAPDAPEERNRYIVSDSDAKLVLTHTNLKEKLIAQKITSNGKIIAIDETLNVESNINFASNISPNSIAYVIYTSGTTGQPKGVEVKHTGIVNYILWRIANYNFKPEDVTMQLFSYHFDGFVSNLFSALLSGGSLALVSDAGRLKADHIIDVIKKEGVTNSLMTPGMYEIVVGELLINTEYLETLRFITLGGEQSTDKLILDSNKVLPHVLLINEYGPTEISVAATCNNNLTYNQTGIIGRPISNVKLYIRDKYDRLSLPGVAGELCISGAGLARGYLNNSDLTSSKFVYDTSLSVRMYKTGDLCRWLPDGNIEFLGRLDDQVKIRGFRIELGEIVHVLQSYDGIGQCSVQVKEWGSTKYLVAYYTCVSDVSESSLREYLSSRLPEYMVPTHYELLEQMPLNSSGKLDKKLLPLPKMQSSADYIEAETEVEGLLSTVWSKVLGIDRISIQDNFFSVGGDSIKSIQISSRMRTLGYDLSVKDIFTHPTIKRQGLCVKAIARVSPQGAVTGKSGITPIQHWFFESNQIDKHHFNQSVMLNFPAFISREAVSDVFEKLQTHHDALRMVFEQTEGEVQCVNKDVYEMELSLEEFDLRGDEHAADTMLNYSNRLQSGIDISSGPLMRLGLYQTATGSRLLIVIHHLVIDGVSWRILFEDIDTLYHQRLHGEKLSLPLKTDSFQSWSSLLRKYTESKPFQIAQNYWTNFEKLKTSSIPKDHNHPRNPYTKDNVETIQLSKKDTFDLLHKVNRAFNTQINDILLAALLMSIKKRYSINAIKVDIEGHGREYIEDGIHLNRTLGWFTIIYPILLEYTGDEISGLIKHVKETIRGVPNNGIDYLLGKQINTEKTHASQIVFNYLGQFDADLKGKAYQIANDPRGEEMAHGVQDCDWSISGVVADDALTMQLGYSCMQYDTENVRLFMADYKDCLKQIITYNNNRDEVLLTPSDLTYNKLSISELDDLQNKYQIKDIYPLSPMQEGMLFHTLMDDSDSYFLQTTYRQKGNLNVIAAEQSLSALIERHDILRTIFLPREEENIQLVLKQRKTDFDYKDIQTECVNGDKDFIIASYKRKSKTKKFNLASDVAIRLQILKIDRDEYAFIWSYHHILMDGWCIGIIANEFNLIYESYENQKAIVLPATQPFSTYIQWIEKRNKKESGEYWKAYLTGYETVTMLPQENSKKQSTTLAYEFYQFILDTEQTKSLHKLSQNCDATLNTVLQAAWGLLLSFYNNSNDVLFGTVVSGRPPEIEGIENMVGLFINTTPTRIQFDDRDTVEDLIKRIQNNSAKSEPYHYHPLYEIQSFTGLGKNLLNHILVFENFPVTGTIANSNHHNPIDVNSIKTDELTNYDLTIIIIPGEEIKIKFDYNTNVYSKDVINALARHYKLILDQIVLNTKSCLTKIEILTNDEKKKLVNDFNKTADLHQNAQTVVHLFDRQVERTPNNVALKFKDRRISYLSLKDQIDKIAYYLMENCKIKSGDFVGLILERDEYLFPVILAVLKVGAAYIPIDIKHPTERINSIIEESGLKLIITRNNRYKLSNVNSVANVDLNEILEGVYVSKRHWSNIEVLPTDLAYVIYTSGSTGKSKGVMIEHGSLVNIILAMQARYPLNEDDVFLLKTTYSFDVSVAELFGWFLAGGSLSILPSGAELEPQVLLNTIEKDRVTHVNFVPSMFSAFLEEFEKTATKKIGNLKYIFLAGEALPVELAKRFHAIISSLQLENVYGPTEGTIYTSAYTVNNVEYNSAIPIGRPISNVKLYIRDKYDRLSLPGVAGELCISGAGLARGYLNNSDLTSSKFVYDTSLSVRMYKTGDLCRWLPDGNIEFLGRLDDQVKIRGFRIELGEVVHVLQSYDGIGQCSVQVKEWGSTKYLVAYYTCVRDVSESSLRDYLSSRLPEYMVPTHYELLEQMPLNSSGKLDKKLLPLPKMQSSADYIEAETEVEGLLSTVWSKVLGIDRISIQDNFFSVGGDSIKSIQISSRMRTLGYDLSVKDIFTHPTIKSQGLCVKTIARVSPQGPVTGKSGITPIQHWFFESNQIDKHHFNQSVMLNFPAFISREAVSDVFEKLQTHHDALRMVFEQTEGEVQCVNKDVYEMELSLEEFDLREDEHAADTMLNYSNRLQSGIDISSGPLMRLGLYQTATGSRLLIVIHHLVIDGVSWRILFEDIDTLYHQRLYGEKLSLPLKTDSFQSWSSLLRKYAESKPFQIAQNYWTNFEKLKGFTLFKDEQLPGEVKDTVTASFKLDKALTKRLLSDAHSSFNTQINDILLTAFLNAYSFVFKANSVLIDLEGHGRESLDEHCNYSRTVGWFTTIYPILLQKKDNDKSKTLKYVKEILRNIPNNGVDYMLGKYFSNNEKLNLDKIEKSKICFNYLGQFDSDLTGKVYQLMDGEGGHTVSLNASRKYNWEIVGMVTESELSIQLSYSSKSYTNVIINSLMAAYKKELAAMIAFCSNANRISLTPSDLTYKKLSIKELDVLESRYQIEDIYPLSPMQEGMLFHSLSNSDSNSYLGQTTCYINGELDLGAIEDSMNDIVARYDILRASFLHSVSQDRIQVIVKNRRIPFLYLDVREDCLSKPYEEVISSYREKDKATKFDFGEDMLMRLSVLQTDEKKYALLWSHHHLLLDGWCMGLIIHTFETLYEARIRKKSIVLDPVLPYSRYIKWLTKQNTEQALRYWSKYLENYEHITGLQKAGTEPLNNQTYRLASHQLVIDKATTQLLYRISKEYGVTVNTLLQVAWAILLGRFNNVTDVVFGAVVSGRPAALEGVEAMVGLFINTIPVRITYNHNEKVFELLKRVQNQSLQSEAYHYSALAEIKAENKSNSAMFDHILVLENFPDFKQTAVENSPFQVERVHYNVQTNFDLSVKLIPGEELNISFDYNANQFERENIEAYSSLLENILQTFSLNPKQLIGKVDIFNTAELKMIKQEFSKPLENVAKVEILQLKLKTSFKLHANLTAIEYSGELFLYQDVWFRANQIAGLLEKNNVAEQAYIGVLCEDRVWLICAMLAVLNSRMVFVPLETGLPSSRLTSIVRQTSMQYIITDQHIDDFSEIQSIDGIAWLTINEAVSQNGNQCFEKYYSADDKMYVYFTSGSTGIPKGVIGKNKGLAHFISWEISAFDIDSSFRFMQLTNPGFDVFLRDILVPLCAGATICIPDIMHISTGDKIGEWIDSEEISFIHCVPSLFKLFNTEKLSNKAFQKLRFILLAGEKILPYELITWYKKFNNRIKLVNIYGPTETTLAKAYFVIHPSTVLQKFIPVKPIEGSQLLILDQFMSVCPDNAVGEIYIRTPYRTAGYLNSEDNLNKFISNPYSTDEGDLLYKTGDLGRKHKNGEIEILGRTDSQIKINGVRIELDDIKSNILKYNNISDALIVVNEDESGKVIVAYIIAKRQLDMDNFRMHLKLFLPRHMVPSHLITLDKFPLLINGKINRAALPKPDLQKIDKHTEAQSSLEVKLIAIWADVLKISEKHISVHSNFFQIGGHSIRAFNLIYKIQNEFAVSISLTEIFTHTTVKELAILISGRNKPAHITVIPRIGNKINYPASPAQERMYFQHLLHNNSVIYNISAALKIISGVNIEKLKNAFQELVNRHESLRTSFILSTNGVLQKINDNVKFDIEQSTYENLSTQQAFTKFIRPFDLSSNSQLRVCLHIDEKRQPVLFVDIHHIICDGYSLNILISEFSKIYKGELLPTLDLSYVDYSCWLNNLKNNVDQQESYWSRKLAPPIQQLDLPVKIQSAEYYTHVTEVKLLKISAEEYEIVKRFAVEANVSDFMLLLAVYYLLLARVTSCTDIIVGTDAIGRTTKQLQNVVGTFVNILPLRVDFDPEISFSVFLHKVKLCVLEAFENQDFQIDQMTKVVKSENYLDQQPIVKVHFSFSNIIESTSVDIFEPLPIKSRRDDASEYELKLEVRELDKAMDIAFIYGKEMYDDDTIALFIAYYHNILRSVVKNSQISIGNIGSGLVSASTY